MWWTSSVISARRRWAAGALLVALGALASPQLVPVYDGIGTPDEPYRYVATPASATKTAAPTSASGQSPLANGLTASAFSVQTAETGPQFQLFLPAGGLKATGTKLVITVTPKAPTDSPPSTKPDGNVYDVAVVSYPPGPVTLTPEAALATMYLRATSQKTPQPDMYYRPTASSPWQALKTTAGGFDVRVVSFKGAGEYVVAHPSVAKKSSGGGGVPVLALVLVVVLVVLGAVVLVVRLRAAPE